MYSFPIFHHFQEICSRTVHEVYLYNISRTVHEFELYNEPRTVHEFDLYNEPRTVYELDPYMEPRNGNVLIDSYHMSFYSITVVIFAIFLTIFNILAVKMHDLDLVIENMPMSNINMII